MSILQIYFSIDTISISTIFLDVTKFMLNSQKIRNKNLARQHVLSLFAVHHQIIEIFELSKNHFVSPPKCPTVVLDFFKKKNSLNFGLFCLTSVGNI